MNKSLLKRIFATFLFNLLFVLLLSGQNKFTVSGFVSDRATGERLAGATVFNSESKSGTACNNYGFFSLKVPDGRVTLLVRFVGYETQVQQLQLKNDTVLDFRLSTNNQLGEVMVQANSNENFIRSRALGVNRLTGNEVEKIPTVLGEPDILKAIKLLPGVSFASEGTSGFSVRGGSPDQTLIMLDGVPVYNVNHLLGFLSLFNNDAINDSKLYKGSLPARFGGRLSSVLDISMKEGNLEKQAGTFSLSPIAGRYTMEGPIVKNKASYMVSARRSWIDVLFMEAQKQVGDGEQFLTYGFWDINAKANWIINRNNRLFLSFYTGRDAYQMREGEKDDSDYVKFSYNWQNLTGVLRWNHVFSPDLFANFSVYNSRYKQTYLIKYNVQGNNHYKGFNNLNDVSLKGDFDWFNSGHQSFQFGYQLSYKKFSPEIISIKDDSTSIELNKDIFTENLLSEVYFEGNIQLTDRLKSNVGFRTGMMSTSGKNYFSFRPRLSLRYLFSDKLSGKLAYSRMTQYLHQLQNTTLGIPTELWVASTKRVIPGTSDLFSAGAFYQPSPAYDFSAEIYLSNLHHVIQYKPSTMAFKNRGESWEDYVTTGKGKSYGLELMAKKKTGRLTGLLSYTLSKSTRQFADINFGESFPFAYDRRHQVHVVGDLFLGEKQKKGIAIRKSLSANFNFASGNYITLAEREYQGIPLPYMDRSRYDANWLSQRSLIEHVNNYRMPAFHNLHLSYQLKRKKADKTVIWNFSVYNVYDRLNPWYYYKKGNRLRQISLFPIIPSVSYTYKW